MDLKIPRCTTPVSRLRSVVPCYCPPPERLACRSWIEQCVAHAQRLRNACAATSLAPWSTAAMYTIGQQRNTRRREPFVRPVSNCANTIYLSPGDYAQPESPPCKPFTNPHTIATLIGAAAIEGPAHFVPLAGATLGLPLPPLTTSWTKQSICTVSWSGGNLPVPRRRLVHAGRRHQRRRPSCG